MTRDAPTFVRLDKAKNRRFLAIAASLLVGGAALVIAAVVKDWGFLAIFWGSLIPIIGLGWTVGLLRGGGVATADCPHCSTELSFSHVASRRTIQCEACAGWTTGTERMVAVEPGHLADEPVFHWPIATNQPAIRWPKTHAGHPSCPVCEGLADREASLSVSSVIGGLAGALAPVSFEKEHQIAVPACADHDDGIALEMNDDESGVVITFRSFNYSQAFAVLNAQTRASEEPEALAQFLRVNPRPFELGAPEFCPRHKTPVLTAMGWTMTMDILPSGDWMEAAFDHPCCLMLGQSVEKPARESDLRTRLAWCPACEAGMRRR